ncbi:hypothetical protein J2I47_21920 [Fibrella sp. HMF5335]|uniref:Uncharacterized protein n=1 Tax=Fibrella rubiginis TaxID=2817060 RepID=A0A939GMM3_9BACT|nr:hypothetical protein [Fibrella rubiginis]MBO0939227.1 hypothetical protein [Fibrella rubiginis]
MYTIGFIKTERPDVLINPDMCRSVNELHNWLTAFLNKDDFSLSPAITQKGLVTALQPGKPVQMNITGYQVALLFGKDEVIQDATSRFIHLVPRQKGHYPVQRVDAMSIPD